MDMKLLLLICLFLAAEAYVVDNEAHVSHQSKRIIGGETVPRGEAKFLASLWYLKPHAFTTNTGLNHICGGTLIAPRWVLTSAHCFDALYGIGLSVPSNWLVVLGEHHQNVTEAGEQKFSIVDLAIHPKYSSFPPHDDLALVKLNASAISDDYVSTMTLDNDSNCAVIGQKCRAYGWGQTHEAPYGYGAVLPSRTEVTLISKDRCLEAYEGTWFEGTIDDSEICAYDVGKDSCSGDSGGPLLCTCRGAQFVSGVVSHGMGCARHPYPGIYERVQHYSAWIASIVDQ